MLSRRYFSRRGESHFIEQSTGGRTLLIAYCRDRYEYVDLFQLAPKIRSLLWASVVRLVESSSATSRKILDQFQPRLHNIVG